MVKKKYKILIGIGVLIVIGIIYLTVSGFIKISTGAEKVSIWCKQNNISLDGCYLRTPECFYDCRSLNLEYFKLNVQTGLLNGNECYCRLNSEVHKIW